MQNSALAQMSGIAKRYNGAHVLDDVNLTIERGEFVALIGRSGSGKSTLLRVLGGLEPPDAGTVRFAGTDITTLSENALASFRRQSLGFVFQSFNLIETLTVAENIAIPLHLNGYSQDGISPRIESLLGQLELDGHAQKFPDSLSGGEQQRTAIARALAHAPTLVIADEPTGNLDETTARKVMTLLVDECARAGAGLIVATHSDEVRVRSNRTLQLNNGRLEPAA